MASNQIEEMQTQPLEVPEVQIPASGEALDTVLGMSSRRSLSRRNFMTALGVTSAGAALLASRTQTHPDTVLAAGPGPTDILNFALNLEYLEATFYSYITQGVDLPAALTVGSGAITNPPAKLTFTGPNAAQLTDLLNEIYFDEVSHVKALLAVLGTTAIARPPINLAPSAVAVNAQTAPGIARLLEDVGVTAYTGAATALSGTDLTYAAQILAVEAFHSGALRLMGIQNPTTIAYTTTATSTVVGSTTGGSNTLTNVYYNQLNAAVGQTVAGPSLPGGVTVVNLTGYGILGVITLGSTIVTGVTTVTGAASVNGISLGRTITGNGIPSGTTITAIGSSAPYTLTISNPATATTTAPGPLSVIANTPFSATSNKAATLTGVSPTPAQLGMAVGQVVTGPGVPGNTFITAISGTTVTISNKTSTAAKNAGFSVGVGTITLSSPATFSALEAVFFVGTDANDVPTYDPGTPALSAAGPTVHGGFFSTSGGFDASAQVPAGLAFMRTASQVLAILYGGGSVFAPTTTTTGGYFPFGVNGIINTV